MTLQEILIPKNITIWKEFKIDQILDKLTIIGFYSNPKERHRTYAKCQCACGNEIFLIGKQLRKTRACRCIAKETARKNFTKHKHTINNVPSGTYTSWANMIQRCCNPKNSWFSDYGGRGIRVCERWSGKDGFQRFLDDMGERPSNKHSIERINNNGNYTIENCKWGTSHEQSRNTRRTHFIEFNGQRLCVVDWARKLGIPRSRIEKRLKLGWSIEDAFSLKIKKNQYDI
jgi:hypothetical protein